MGKLKDITERYKEFESKHKLKSFREVFVFAFITLTIHFLYNLWAHHYFYYTITLFHLNLPIPDIFQVFADNLLIVSSWIAGHLPGIDITVVKNTIYISNKGFININQSCSGLKQYIQFALLIMCYPGPWKKKFWFIPMGLLAIYLTNVIRIVGLVIVLKLSPTNFHFAHDNIFRPLFYVVIFFLWVLWVEKFKNNPNRIKNKDSKKEV